MVSHGEGSGRQVIWTGYGAKQAARDALLFQTDDIKLQRKIIAEDLDYDSVIKYGLAFEQGNKKVHTMRAQKEGVRTEQEKVACLEDKVRQLEVKRDKKECRTCTRQHEGKCPALQYTCFACSEVGHAKGSKACKKPKPAVKPKKVDKTRQVQEEDTDSEGVGRVTSEGGQTCRRQKGYSHHDRGGQGHARGSHTDPAVDRLGSKQNST